ncbi:hypothetical protein HK405_003770, partial [Cladochytrium tenue]
MDHNHILYVVRNLELRVSGAVDMASQTELFDPPVDGISSVQFSPTDPNLLLASSWDKTVRLYDVASRQVQFRYAHRAAVLDAAFVSDSLVCSGGMVVSGGWDRRLNLWDMRSSEHRTIELPEKVFSMDTVGNKLVVGMSGRTVHIYDLRNLDLPAQHRESSKFMTRVLR